MSKIIKAGQGNCVSNKEAGTVAQLNLLPANVSSVTLVGSPNKTYIPGADDFNTLQSTDTIPKDSSLYIVGKGSDQNNPNFLSASDIPEIYTPISWAQRNLTLDLGQGVILKLGTAANQAAGDGGGTSSKKLIKASGHKARFRLAAALTASSGIIFGLASSNPGTYRFGIDPMVAAAYAYAPTAELKQTTGTGDAGAPGTDTVVKSGLTGKEEVIFEILNNDVLLKVNGTLVHTFSNVLNGVSDIYLVAMLTGEAQSETDIRVLLNAEAVGLAA